MKNRSILVTIVVVVLVVILLLMIVHLRYDPMCSDARCLHRKNGYFKKGYYNSMETKMKEQPFHILSKHNMQPDKSRVISYSLYGVHNKYYKYMLSNIDFIRKHLPDWKIRIYLHSEVDPKWRSKLIDQPDVEIFIMRDALVEPGNSAGAFWRFLPLCDRNVDCVILDVDDKVSIKKVREIRDFFKQNSDDGLGRRQYVINVMESSLGPRIISWPIGF